MKRNAGDSRALPGIPFRRDRWTTVDADIQIKAETILRPKSLPLDHLTAHMRMRDSVLTLDPLDFGVAGGNLVGVVTPGRSARSDQGARQDERKKIAAGKAGADNPCRAA